MKKKKESIFLFCKIFNTNVNKFSYKKNIAYSNTNGSYIKLKLFVLSTEREKLCEILFQEHQKNVQLQIEICVASKLLLHFPGPLRCNQLSYEMLKNHLFLFGG